MKLTIIGRPISKKRSYRTSRNGGFYLSESYKKFENNAIAQIWEQCKPPKLAKPFKIGFEFYIHGKHHVDLDNMITSYMDVLQSAKVITDDDLALEIHAKKIGGCGGWSTKIEIEVLK